jgi:hypothetical protein
MACSRHNEDLLLTDDEIDSITDADTNSLFDSSDDETDITSDADTDSLSEINDDKDDDASLFGDEEQHPPKLYFTTAAKLDVRRLRQ